MFSTAFGTIMIKCYTIHDVALLSRKEGEKKNKFCWPFGTLLTEKQEIFSPSSAGKWKRQMTRMKKKKVRKYKNIFQGSLHGLGVYHGEKKSLENSEKNK